MDGCHDVLVQLGSLHEKTGKEFEPFLEGFTLLLLPLSFINLEIKRTKHHTKKRVVVVSEVSTPS